MRKRKSSYQPVQVTEMNEFDEAKYAERKVAWKRVHGDVFRSPSSYLLFSVMLGTGFQVILMFSVTLIWAFFSGLRELAGLYMMLFPYFGYINGYVSSKFYLFFNGSSWKFVACCSVLFYPILLFSFYKIVYMLDISLTDALFGELSFFTFCFLTIFINLPATATGTYHGFTGDKFETPTKQNRMMRDIPESKGHIQRFCLFFLSGLLPFIAISVQFSQITSQLKRFGSIHQQQQQIYNIFHILPEQYNSQSSGISDT